MNLIYQKNIEENKNMLDSTTKPKTLLLIASIIFSITGFLALSDVRFAEEPIREISGILSSDSKKRPNNIIVSGKYGHFNCPIRICVYNNWRNDLGKNVTAFIGKSGNVVELRINGIKKINKKYIFFKSIENGVFFLVPALLMWIFFILFNRKNK